LGLLKVFAGLSASKIDHLFCLFEYFRINVLLRGTRSHRLDGVRKY
jgi:hypothetical protein